MRQTEVEKTIRNIANGVSPLQHYFSNEREISSKAMSRIERRLRVKV